jgi:anti-sigma-K factor RskA
VARTRQLPPEVRTHARPRRTRSAAPWLPWLSGAIATAAIAVAVFFGFAQAHTQNELNQARAQNQTLAAAQARVEAALSQAREHDQALAQILGAPHVTLLSQRTTKGGVAVVVLDAATRKLVVATSGLPALPVGQVYQLWLIGPVKIVSAGLLPTAQNGVTTPVVATGIVKGDKLGLTVEPAGGSKQPTTTPILALPLPV